MEEINFAEKAKKIGSREGYLGVGIALAIDVAIIVASSFDGPAAWISKNGAYWKFAIFALLMIFWGQVFAKKCAAAIVIKRKPFALTGILYAFATVLASTSLTGVAAYLIDFGSFGSPVEMAYLYMIAPGLLVIFYTGIPIGIHGIILGYRIRNKGKKI